MHLLFATSIVPDGALGSGYEIANEAIIAALRRAGAKVTVLGFSWPGRPPSDPERTIVLGEVDVRTQNATPLRQAAWLAKAVAGGLNYGSAKMRVVDPAAVREAIRSAGPVDAYVLNSVQFAAAFEGVFDDRPTIFIAHNVEWRSADENAQSASSPLQRFLFRRDARILRAVENRLCRRARFVWTLAEDDREALGVASSGKSAVLPLVTRAFPPIPAARQIEFDAGLIGTWTWQPNRVGLDWFLGDVIPRLPHDLRIRIAGGAPFGLSSRHPGVRFVGRVPDAQRIRPFGRRCSVDQPRRHRRATENA